MDKIRVRVSVCGAATETAPTAVSIEPVARYCKYLTVGGTLMPPSVSSALATGTQ